MIGIRISAAIVLGVGVLFLSRIAAFSWVSLTGRPWVSVTITILGSVAILIPFLTLLAWFLKQTDWESTEASAHITSPCFPG